MSDKAEERLADIDAFAAHRDEAFGTDSRVENYVRRAYYIYLGRDIDDEPAPVRRRYAMLPPDALEHDFYEDFSDADFDAIEQRRQAVGITALLHDFDADDAINARIDRALMAKS